MPKDANRFIVHEDNEMIISCHKYKKVLVANYTNNFLVDVRGRNSADG